MLAPTRTATFRVAAAYAALPASDAELAAHVRDRFAPVVASTYAARPGTGHADSGSRNAVRQQLLAVVREAAAGELTVAAAMKVAACVKDERTTEALFDFWTKTGGGAASADMHLSRMHVYSFYGRVEEVADCTRALLAASGWLSSRTYYYLLRALVARKQLPAALKVVDKMVADGVAVDAHCLCAVLKGCASVADLQALRLARFPRKVVKGRKVAEALVGLYAKSGDMRMAERCVRLMRQGPRCKQRWKRSGPSSTPGHTDTATGAALNPDEYLEDLDTRPTDVVWHHLMRAYREKDDLDRLRHAWRRMANDGIAPSATTYAIYMRALRRRARHHDDRWVALAEEAFNHAAAKDLCGPALWSELVCLYYTVGDGEKLDALLRCAPANMRSRLNHEAADIIAVKRHARLKVSLPPPCRELPAEDRSPPPEAAGSAARAARDKDEGEEGVRVVEAGTTLPLQDKDNPAASALAHLADAMDGGGVPG
eukprot:TRINITY_DN19023_c0_g1_i1.p1 TRINITY_DN19023_c0_g1~~TRINITY_DN19023_c0_g1_i1.p1  ORF type:complete len:485 (+),score=108.70 TRINITY_DN19023_c0_g1_i1:164-1618(+)